MKFTATLSVLTLMPMIAYAVDGGRIAKTLYTMADLSRDTSDSAIEMVSPKETVDIYFPEVVRGFAEITTSAQNEVLVLAPNTEFLNTTLPKRQDLDSLTNEAQGLICKSFKEFVEVHQNLLKDIIGKAGLIQNVQKSVPGKKETQQLLKNLVACSQAVTGLTRHIIDFVPSCDEEVKAEKKSCDKTIDTLKNELQNILS